MPIVVLGVEAFFPSRNFSILGSPQGLAVCFLAHLPGGWIGGAPRFSREAGREEPGSTGEQTPVPESGSFAGTDRGETRSPGWWRRASLSAISLVAVINTQMSSLKHECCPWALKARVYLCYFKLPGHSLGLKGKVWKKARLWGWEKPWVWASQ